MTPLQFYEFCSEKILGVKSFFVSSQEIEETAESYLNDRFEQAITIKGTLKFHSFVPIRGSKSHINVQKFSSSPDTTRAKISDVRDQIPLDQNHDYCTIEHENKWFVAHVMSKNSLGVEVELLTPNGPSTSVSFPRKQKIMFIRQNMILSIVNPSTTTGRTYRLSGQEMTTSTDNLSTIEEVPS